jgi:serine O-acetyltransferase
MSADGRARSGVAGLLDAAVGCAGRMREDVTVVMDRDPAVTGLGEALLSPSLAALWLHRVAHTAYRRRHRVLARAIFLAGRQLSGIEIHPGAVVGRRLFIDHGAATVIGETAVIGDDVTIYHQVTLGAVGWWRDNRRADGERRHPVVGDRVVLGANCVVLGPVTIGDDVRIGAQTLVCEDVPAGARVRAQPCQVAQAPRASVNGAPSDGDGARLDGTRPREAAVSERSHAR